jgi:hypothetical protein
MLAEAGMMGCVNLTFGANLLMRHLTTFGTMDGLSTSSLKK